MTLTLDDIKNLSPMRKAFLVCLIFLLLGYLYYAYFYKGAFEKKGKLAERLSSIQYEMIEKRRVVKQIKKYKKELTVLRKDLQIALTKLPERKEIPVLLDSVSESGRKEDLDFLLFEPSLPVSKEFYAEIPVKIEVTGSYHSVVLFFEKVAKLPRIMNVTDISIKKKGNVDEDDESNTLITSCLVKTYMFLEKVEGKGAATVGSK